MFGWRKKNDGFDWHAYVRTTIKVRREARRERIDAARQAALEQAHAAGHAVVDGGKAAGRAAIKGVQGGAVHGVQGLGWFWHNLARAFRAAFGPLGEWLMTSTARTAKKLAIWEFAGPIALVGAVALASGLFRWSQTGFTAETAVPIGLGLTLVGLSVPGLIDRSPVSMAAVRGSPYGRFGVVGALVFVAAAGLFTLTRQGGTVIPQLGSLSKFAVLPTGSSVVEGRAAVVTADTLRVNGALYRLSGIEAPDRAQSCGSGTPKWRCGEAAVSALVNLARSRVVACKPSGTADVTGRTTAVCSVDGKDVASAMVRGGHVFATQSLFGGYGGEENEAKSAKRGLWKGDAERPSVWRDKLWSEAKKSSPEGCPIKAVMNGAAKVYLMPWSSDYKKAAVRPARGERWFCSENEAVAAGYRPAERS